MARRRYSMGRRQVTIDHTRASILAAARKLVAGGSAATVAAVAQQAGVSRITVYNQFGSRTRLLEALVAPNAPVALPDGDPRDQLRAWLAMACSRWASDPALFRHLSITAAAGDADLERHLAERLAAGDHLRPGCSIKEAEDVIGALSSFALFDRLHKDGRRTPIAVAEILMRLTAAILA